MDATGASQTGAESKLEAPIRTVPNTKVKVAFPADLWGAYIELTENLAPSSL